MDAFVLLTTSTSMHHLLSESLHSSDFKWHTERMYKAPLRFANIGVDGRVSITTPNESLRPTEEARPGAWNRRIAWPV